MPSPCLLKWMSRWISSHGNVKLITRGDHEFLAENNQTRYRAVTDGRRHRRVVSLYHGEAWPSRRYTDRIREHTVGVLFAAHAAQRFHLWRNRASGGRADLWQDP